MMLTANAADGLTEDAGLLHGPFQPLADVAELQSAGAAHSHVGGKAVVRCMREALGQFRRSGH